MKFSLSASRKPFALGAAAVLALCLGAAQAAPPPDGKPDTSAPGAMPAQPGGMANPTVPETPQGPVSDRTLPPEDTQRPSDPTKPKPAVKPKKKPQADTPSPAN